MINYFIRPGGVYVKINTSTQDVDLVLDMSAQKTFSVITNNLDYYNSAVSASASWTTSDQTAYDLAKTNVLQYLNNR